ncbi:protein FANTASTIC FOUR 2-like [Impatiens glandulifera]|uniref:protein FANTASTIC FOUR 2-like n=1 Tax=Impatiens glandulifera TaxID=253017 RepID=UPI001FB15CCF|nr:protein FANTASTIC FOUR 2-like [Impatiens glandulifera]
MSTTVSQGLQSCLEPPFLKNKFAQSRSNLSANSNEDYYGDNDDNKNRGGKDGNLGGWSFIQALTHISQTPKEIKEAEKIYIHPMTKNSSSTLSKKSLEMCTESLGSETGSDTGESIEELIISSNFPVIQRSKLVTNKKASVQRGSFPPPLSSIRGSESVQVRPHREGGRLLIKAVTVNSNKGYFQTERCDGRLRLFLFKEDEDDDDDDDDDDGDEKEEEEESGINEGGIGEISRLSRCKEGGNEMSKWGPIRVAIS